jgi:pimeloyl-ACP methyl ester carboxylesterase
VANACEAGLPLAWHAWPPKSVAVANAPINGFDVYYEVSGDGSPLLIINGSGSTIDDVRPLIGLLVPAFRLATADSRGVSRTSARRDYDRPTHLDETTCTVDYGIASPAAGRLPSMVDVIQLPRVPRQPITPI